LPDALIALGLGTVAFIVRRHVPADGLFYDDAWQAFAAWKGSWSELITVGQSQPGFTAGLMVWTRVFGTSSASLVTPALIAGTLGPPVLYLVLRRFDHARSTAFLVGAALTSASMHIMYSYHVKTYTTDVLIMLGLALAVYHLARRRWETSTAVVWTIASIAVGSFSSIALIGTIVAGSLLVLHSSGDLKRRAVAVGVQVVVLGALGLASSRTYGYGMIHSYFARREGYIDFDPNPVTFGREIFSHLWNVADVYPGGRPMLALALAGVGLVAAAWRGPLAVPARFFALMIVLAAGASMLGLVPFGPTSDQGRVSLWMVPAIALGLCAGLELVRRRLATRVVLRTGFDVVACVAGVLILVSALDVHRPYHSGARSAIRQVMLDAGQDDAIWITRPTTYSFALYGETPVDVRPRPDRAPGIWPEFADPRLLAHDFTTTRAELDTFVDGVDRVFVVHADVDRVGYANYLFRLMLDLALKGFVRESTTRIRTGVIDVWQRSPDPRRVQLLEEQLEDALRDERPD
jgi:hypothetical protein